MVTKVLTQCRLLISVTGSINQRHNILTKWTKLTVVDHCYPAPVLSLSPPVVVGGVDITGKTSTLADIKTYDYSNRSWKKIVSLSSTRAGAAVAAVYNNAIIIIGGCTKADTSANSRSSSLIIVELGQAELLH